MNLREDIERHREILECEIPDGWERVEPICRKFPEEVCFQKGKVRILVGEWAVLNPMRGIDVHHGRASVRVVSPGRSVSFSNVQFKSKNSRSNVRRAIARAVRKAV